MTRLRHNRTFPAAPVESFGPVPGGFAISRIELATEGSVPGTDA
jgi:hypothetical protein